MFLFIKPTLLASSLLLTLTACGGDNNNISNSNSIPLQGLVIDVASAVVTPQYKLNGGPFPQSEYNDGNFLLRGVTESSDLPLLGSSHFFSPDPVRIVQGTYDVLYQHETGDSVPQNVGNLVQTPEVISGDRALVTDVTAWSVTPSFTLNAGAFPQTEYDDARFYLQPSTGGERIFLGNSHSEFPDTVIVMEGTYDVIYELETEGATVPRNQSAVVMSGVNITSDQLPLLVPVTTGDIDFDATLDGDPFPGSQYQRAEFFLRNNSSGDLVELGISYELSSNPPIPVIQGTYDIVYRHLQGDQLPANVDAVLSNVVIGSIRVIESISIAFANITPSFSLNGGSFPVSEYNDGNFYLRGESPEDVFLLGSSHSVNPAAVQVISGNYDVLYRHESGTQVPQNTNAQLQTGVVLDADGDLPVPVIMIGVSGEFTLNGNNFPADENESVQFLLRDAADVSDEFIFGFSDINNGAVKLIPGTYDVLIDHVDGDSVPQNVSRVVQSSVLLDSDQSYDVIYEHLFGEQTPQNTNSVVGNILVQ